MQQSRRSARRRLPRSTLHCVLPPDWEGSPPPRTTPSGVSCADEEIYKRAAGYGIPGTKVDGNDVRAVLRASRRAVSRARKGEGPSLIECKTYRHRGHFEGDPCVYRNEEEVDEWKAKDPLPRFEKKLMEINALTQEKIGEIKNTIEKQLAEAAEFAEKSPFPDPSEVTEDVYTS